MGILHLEQRSEEWKMWRRSHITATDASIILGVNPYCDAKTLWGRKLGIYPEQEINAAMQRGSDLEEEALGVFNSMHLNQFGLSKEFIPCCFESDEYRWAAASLDGISEDGKHILEIKCLGEKNHIKIFESEKCPEYYYAQIQHQLFVTKAESCILFLYNPDLVLYDKCIQCVPDKEYIKKMIEKEKDFFLSLCTMSIPNDCWVNLKEKYLFYKNSIENSEKELEKIREEMIKFTDGKDFKDSGLSLKKITIPGRIKYDSIEELKSIDLEKYRGEPSSSWRVMISGE